MLVLVDVRQVFKYGKGSDNSLGEKNKKSKRVIFFVLRQGMVEFLYIEMKPLLFLFVVEGAPNLYV